MTNDSHEPTTQEDETIFALYDAVHALRAGDIGWSDWVRERLLVAIESALDVYKTGASPEVSLNAKTLLGLVRGGSQKIAEPQIAEAAKRYAFQSIGDPARAGAAGSIAYGICGSGNQTARQIDEIIEEEIVLAYQAGAALMQARVAPSIVARRSHCPKCENVSVRASDGAIDSDA